MVNATNTNHKSQASLACTGALCGFSNFMSTLASDYKGADAAPSFYQLGEHVAE
jgi:hypothetical protein